MTKLKASNDRDAGHGSAAAVSIRIGKHSTLDGSMTVAGLLSVGALVSGILLSSAVIVVVARRNVGKAAKPAIPALP